MKDIQNIAMYTNNIVQSSLNSNIKTKIKYFSQKQDTFFLTLIDKGVITNTFLHKKPSFKEKESPYYKFDFLIDANDTEVIQSLKKIHDSILKTLSTKDREGITKAYPEVLNSKDFGILEPRFVGVKKLSIKSRRHPFTVYIALKDKHLKISRDDFTRIMGIDGEHSIFIADFTCIVTPASYNEIHYWDIVCNDIVLYLNEEQQERYLSKTHNIQKIDKQENVIDMYVEEPLI